MMKLTQKYYFSVEGETEQWYLEWLEDEINNTPEAKYRVSIDAKIQKNPLKRAKTISALSKIEITHMCDCESNGEVHTTQFKDTLDLLKKTKDLGKQITYSLGYSNFTFELWMVLHKTTCNGPLSHRRQYLTSINRAYDENFENMDQYKHEDNFRRILRKLSLSDVKLAVSRAKAIMQDKENGGYVLQQYKGYQYYTENPSLSIWQYIDRILTVCGC